MHYHTDGSKPYYTFKLNNGFKDAEIYSQDIDLTPYGGATAFKTNYQTIDIYTPDFGIISADIDQLITSGELELPYNGQQFVLGATGKITGDDYPETNQGLSYTNLDIGYIYKLKLVVSGDKIVFKMFISLDIYGFSGDQKNERKNHN